MYRTAQAENYSFVFCMNIYVYQNRRMDYEAKQNRRRTNLAAAANADKRGGITAFAKAHDIDATLISQLLNGRTFTEKQARDIEEKAGMPVGALDLEPGAGVMPGSMEEIEEVFSKATWMPEKTRSDLLGLIRVIHDNNSDPSKQ